MCHVNRLVFHAQGQTQRRSNNRRGSNKQKSYTVDFIKKTLMFWIHWNHQLISTTQLESNKESTDHWWLSVKKTEANFLQDWLLAKQRRTQVVQGQWDREGVLLRTDSNALISILWLPIFYSPSLNYGEQQEAMCPDLGSKKKNWKSKMLWRRRSWKIWRKQQLAPEIQGKTQHITEEKDQQGKSRGRWWPGYDPEIPQGFEESLENTKEKKQVLYSWPKVWKMET